MSDSILQDIPGIDASLAFRWIDETTVHVEASHPFPLKGVMISPAGEIKLGFGSFRLAKTDRDVDLRTDGAIDSYDYDHPLQRRLQSLVRYLIDATLSDAAKDRRFQQAYWDAMAERALTLISDYEESHALSLSLTGREASIREQMASESLRKLEGLDQCLLTHECPFSCGHGYRVLVDGKPVSRQDRPLYRAAGDLTSILHLHYRDAKSTAKASGGTIERVFVMHGRLHPVLPAETRDMSPAP